MDENRGRILQESKKIISKLHLHSAFFSDEIIYKIYLRTLVIHQLFESSEDLDINKLELFHLQFSSPVIDLLKQIKKANEKSVSVLYNELELNEGLINQLNQSVLSEESFNADKQRQSLKINTSLRKLYNILSEDSTEYPFAKNINSFSSKYAGDFYFDIPLELLLSLIEYSIAEVYQNTYAIIERKLMGQLCKYEFRSEFYCGLKAGDAVLEVFKIIDKEIYFFFYQNRNLFLKIDASAIADLHSENLSKRATLIHELKDKNDKLENRARILKSEIPVKIKNLLTDHYKKISDIDFLQNIANFDVQANILRTMLNTDSF